MEIVEKDMVGGGREMRFRESVWLSAPLLPTDSKRYLIQACAVEQQCNGLNIYLPSSSFRFVVVILQKITQNTTISGDENICFDSRACLILQ